MTTSVTASLTPCIRVCVLDSRTDSCIGCGRLRSEIAAWRGLSDDQRRAIMADLPDRLRRMSSRETRGRGGRRAALAAAGGPPDPASFTVPTGEPEG
ncbi:MAG: DUF1289 domain-containing protein [Alphaproteobacteria bacterium]|nr:DUF1289 domain-containing protein [Alphaproteobacteria bacterium]